MAPDSSLQQTSFTNGLVALSAVAKGETVTIRKVRTGALDGEEGDIGLRLLELGFVEGESLRVIAHGYPGREPIAVRIGNTTFALRRLEADHILVARSPLQGEAPAP